jgi:simple sugar transport system ATP-binding protein
MNALTQLDQPEAYTVTAVPALDLAGVGKTFGSFVALDDVSMKVAPGSVHALLGENGAGKSTLVKCIMGYHRPDAGVISVDGTRLVARNPREAGAFGVGMVYQHFTVVENMTVTENLLLAQRRQPFVLDLRAEEERVRAFMATMPFQLDARTPVRALSAGEKQKLEILKQLFLGSRILILDEPTSVLAPAEADQVLGLLRDMTRAGRLTILLITHKFREVTGYCDEVTVLRRGKYVGGGRVDTLTTDAMAAMMVGSALPKAAQAKTLSFGGKVVLDVAALCANDDLGLPAVEKLSLQVAAGEIVGVAGVSGNGQRELVEVLAGQRPARGGSIAVSGHAYRATRTDMNRHGVRCLPDEPLANACVPGMTVAENMALRRFDRPPLSRFPRLVRHGRVRHEARTGIEEYGIRAPSADTPIGALSGGNVQRVVLARELCPGAKVLVVSNPCFGLDFAAVAEIRARLLAARDEGTAILLVSADLDEVLSLSDRIVVMSEGRIVHETSRERLDLAVLGRAMAGHA